MEEPRPIGCEKLVGKSDRYRVRVGRYRVAYSIAHDDLVVVAVRVADRKEVHRQVAWPASAADVAGFAVAAAEL